MNATENRLGKLKVFLRFLYINGIVDISKIHEDSDEGFINRLKIQKCVYLAKYYGLDLGYKYNMYMYGPYSADLSNEYYSVIDDIIAKKDYYYHNNNKEEVEELEGFDAKKFLVDIKNKDANWLELATTAINLSRVFKGDELLEVLYEMKGHRFPKEFIDKVYNEILALVKIPHRHHNNK